MSQFTRRLGAVALAVAVAQGALAQTASTNPGSWSKGQEGPSGVTAIVTNKKPDRSIKGPKGLIESTYKIQPQIQPVFTFGRIYEHENPKFVPPTLNETNTLPVGDATLPNRVSAGAFFPAINATGWVPPDPDVAVGPNHVVCVVNVSIGFFTKTGTKQLEVGLGNVAGTTEGFFESLGVSDFVFDPKCFYDPVSQRFFVVALELDTATEVSKVLVGVSDDSDPNGNWFKYRIEAKQTVGENSFWLDYPGFGCNKDAVVITGNMFGFVGGFNGVQYIVINKAQLMSGAQPNINYFSLTSNGSAQVMRSNDPNVDRVYCASLASSSALLVHSITNLQTTPALSTRTVAVPSFFFPNQGAESTQGHRLDSLDGRLLNVMYRNGRLYTTHTVRQSQSNGTNMVRWYEVGMNDWPTGGTPVTIQSGNVAAASGTHQFMPAIAVNGQGEVATVFTRSSSSIVADLMAAGRRASDPPGTMGTPLLLATSNAPAYGGSNNRWGDYFGIQVDPVDDKTFWGFGMVANSSGGWITMVEKFNLVTTVDVPPTTIVPVESSGVTGTLADVLTSNNSYYSVRSVSVMRSGQISSAAATFQPATSNAELELEVEANGPNLSSVAIYAWNWNTSQWDHKGAFPLSSTDGTGKVRVTGSMQPYYNGSGQVKFLIRAIKPNRPRQAALPFWFNIDKVTLKVTS